MTLVSKKEGAALNTPCNSGCGNPQISADGSFVAFESDATDLDAGTSGLPKPQVYRGTAAGADVLPVATDFNGVLTDEVSFLGTLSADGTYVVFHSVDKQLLTPPATTSSFIIRKNLVTQETVLVTDQPGFLPVPIFPNGYMPSVSADGRMVAFMSRDSALAGGIPLNHSQVFVRDLQKNKVFYCSRHKDGTPSNLDCDVVRISGDGSWVIWSTQGSTLVDGDTNGVSDVFLRGPLR
jgi:Tol biopolymer transport system component